MKPTRPPIIGIWIETTCATLTVAVLVALIALLMRGWKVEHSYSRAMHFYALIVVSLGGAIIYNIYAVRSKIKRGRLKAVLEKAVRGPFYVEAPEECRAQIIAMFDSSRLARDADSADAVLRVTFHHETRPYNAAGQRLEELKGKDIEAVVTRHCYRVSVFAAGYEGVTSDHWNALGPEFPERILACWQPHGPRYPYQRYLPKPAVGEVLEDVKGYLARRGLLTQGLALKNRT